MKFPVLKVGASIIGEEIEKKKERKGDGEYENEIGQVHN
jgi:hypothetical protein